MKNNYKLPLGRKPIGWTNKLKLKAIINTLSNEKLETFKFPCLDCLVAPSCTKYCTIVFIYINYMVDRFPNMTADEIYVYRHTVPKEINRYIEKMFSEGSILVHPNL